MCCNFFLESPTKSTRYTSFALGTTRRGKVAPTLTHAHARSHTHTHTHAHTRSHTHTLTHAHARSHTHTLAHTRTHTHTLAHAHARSHTHTFISHIRENRTPTPTLAHAHPHAPARVSRARSSLRFRDLFTPCKTFFKKVIHGKAIAAQSPLQSHYLKHYLAQIFFQIIACTTVGGMGQRDTGETPGQGETFK